MIELPDPSKTVDLCNDVPGQVQNDKPIGLDTVGNEPPIHLVDNNRINEVLDTDIVRIERCGRRCTNDQGREDRGRGDKRGNPTNNKPITAHFSSRPEPALSAVSEPTINVATPVDGGYKALDPFGVLRFMRSAMHPAMRDGTAFPVSLCAAHDPVVQRSRTLAFQAGNAGSNPVGVTVV